MSISDRVNIRLGGKTLLKCESYEVHMGLLTQPSRFSLRVGHASHVRDLLDEYPPNTPCEIRVEAEGVSTLQFKGTIDARRAAGPDAILELRGRDALSKLCSSYADADKSYTGYTYHDLVNAVLADAGYADEGFAVVDSMVDDVRAKTGATRVVDTRRARGKKVFTAQHHIRPGERRYDFLKRILDRAGMCLLATAGGYFVLMEPDASAPPLYQIINTRQQGSRGPIAPGTVLNYDFDEDATDRFSEAVVMGRFSGSLARYGVPTVHQESTDTDMVKWGYKRRRGFIHAGVQSLQEAEFYARRQVAEACREGHALSYRLAGHTTRALDGGHPLVWSRCTMVDVRDDELGIHGPHYIESVVLSGTGDETSTTIRLMRPSDMVFGEDVKDAAE